MPTSDGPVDDLHRRVLADPLRVHTAQRAGAATPARTREPPRLVERVCERVVTHAHNEEYLAAEDCGRIFGVVCSAAELTRGPDSEC